MVYIGQKNLSNLVTLPNFVHPKYLNSKSRVAFFGFTKLNNLCFKILYTFRTDSPFSRVQISTLNAHEKIYRVF